MKDIILFIGSLSSGGAEHQLSVLANMLSDELGYKVTIVTFADEDDHYDIDSRIKRVRIAPQKNKYIKFLQIFLYFLNTKADCIISFTQRANLLSLIPILFKNRKVTFIAGERNYTIGGGDKIERILFNVLYKRTNWIVTNSFSQAQYINHRKPELAEKIQTITNYTNLDTYKPQKYKFHNNKFAIFCRYDPQKNYERFALAIKLLKEQLGEVFHIDWFGNVEFKGNTNPHYKKLLRLIELYGIQNVLTLNSHVKNVSERLHQYDAILLPSLYEGFSNAIGEAICCACPMIVSNISDNGIMVKDEINGFLFNPNDEMDMAKAIEKFILLPFDKRKQMSDNSRKIAETLFDKSQFLNRYLSLIEDHV